MFLGVWVLGIITTVAGFMLIPWPYSALIGAGVLLGSVWHISLTLVDIKDQVVTLNQRLAPQESDQVHSE